MKLKYCFSLVILHLLLFLPACVDAPSANPIERKLIPPGKEFVEVQFQGHNRLLITLEWNKSITEQPEFTIIEGKENLSWVPIDIGGGDLRQSPGAFYVEKPGVTIVEIKHGDLKERYTIRITQKDDANPQGIRSPKPPHETKPPLPKEPTPSESPHVEEPSVTPSPTVPVVPTVSSVKLLPETATVNIGTSLSLNALVIMSDGTSSSEVTWESSDSTVITVNDGNITGMKEGTATITARAKEDTSIKAESVVTVISDKQVVVSSVSILPATVTMKPDETVNLQPVVTMSNGTSNKNISWTSSDSNIVSVDPEGQILAIQKGNATITARAIADETKFATATISVEEESSITVSSVKINTDTTSTLIGKAINLSATITMSDKTTHFDALWESSNPDIASVEHGLVTGKKEGTALITAKAKSDPTKSDSVTITITSEPILVESVTISPENASIKVGETITLLAIVTMKNGSTNSEVIWSSNNSSANVTNGKVTGNSVGTATIIAKAISDESKFYSAIITVTSSTPTPPPPQGLHSSNIGSSSFTLHWGSLAEAESYNVYRNGSLVNGNITTTSITINGLSPKTTYQMQVSAINSGGESPKSDSLLVTTTASYIQIHRFINPNNSSHCFGTSTSPPSVCNGYMPEISNVFKLQQTLDSSVEALYSLDKGDDHILVPQHKQNNSGDISTLIQAGYSQRFLGYIGKTKQSDNYPLRRYAHPVAFHFFTMSSNEPQAHQMCSSPYSGTCWTLEDGNYPNQTDTGYVWFGNTFSTQ